MKSKLLSIEMEGHPAIFYLNKAGCMWYSMIKGKPHGMHENREFKSDEDMEETLELLEQNLCATLFGDNWKDHYAKYKEYKKTL